MEQVYSIYLITNLINNKKYVGITKQYPATKRFHQHCSPKGPAQIEKPLHRAIQKYGKTNFKFEVLETFNNLTEGLEREKHHIKEYNTTNNTIGYNLTEGGDGVWGYKFSDSQKKQLSQAQKKRFSNPEERKKYSDMQKGKIQSCESNQKRSDALKGRSTRGSGWSMPEEHKQAISQAMMGHTKSDSFKEKTRQRMSKTWQLTSPDNQIYIISNLRQFCREHNLSAENLWKVSKGIIYQSQGWKCKIL